MGVKELLGSCGAQLKLDLDAQEWHRLQGADREEEPPFPHPVAFVTTAFGLTRQQPGEWQGKLGCEEVIWE